MNAAPGAGASTRALAARAVAAVLAGRTLDAALGELERGLTEPRDRAFLRALAYGAVRGFERYRFWIARLAEGRGRRLEPELAALIAVGLHQLAAMRVPAHAAVAATVDAAPLVRRARARGLVNAVLRRYQREAGELAAAATADEVARYAHPRWLIDALRTDWPDAWHGVLEAGGAPPPMWLRANRRLTNAGELADRCRALGVTATRHTEASDAVCIEPPLDVSALPGFAAGACSVQDAAAQLAADYLRPAAGQRVLDLCAAPGGKTAHLLERCDVAELVAVDVDGRRLAAVAKTLERIGRPATLVEGDGADPAAWWDGRPFDRILLDAPCSATGVIRRHPDIKLLRRAGDLGALVERQRALLDAAWSMLAPGGRMLYATCSVLKCENREVVEGFLAGRADAVPSPLDGPSGPADRQILTGETNMDGFYYASLSRRVSP